MRSVWAHPIKKAAALAWTTLTGGAPTFTVPGCTGQITTSSADFADVMGAPEVIDKSSGCGSHKAAGMRLWRKQTAFTDEPDAKFVLTAPKFYRCTERLDNPGACVRVFRSSRLRCQRDTVLTPRVVCRHSHDFPPRAQADGGPPPGYHRNRSVHRSRNAHRPQSVHAKDDKGRLRLLLQIDCDVPGGGVMCACVCVCECFIHVFVRAWMHVCMRGGGGGGGGGKF